MPAKTAKQQRYMAMCAHNPKKGCPSKEVAKEFSHKPKGGYKKKAEPRDYGKMTKELYRK